MKRVLSIAAIALLGTAAFTSCKKDYTCSCTIKTITLSDNKEVDQTVRKYTIRDNEDAAKDACKYYELEVKHLDRPAIEQHYCEIED